METFDFKIEEIGDLKESGTVIVEDLTKSSAWEIVEVEPTINLDNFNLDETILYNGETRQRLTNDLEELEYFLRQRLQEL